jgi:hypothetical protein
MPERGEILGQIIEDGPIQGFETVITYKMGHLPLDHFPYWGGEHVQGFWGDETRIAKKRLKLHTIETINTPVSSEQPNPVEEIATQTQETEINQPITIS